jgi:hypothetical protein
VSKPTIETLGAATLRFSLAFGIRCIGGSWHVDCSFLQPTLYILQLLHTACIIHWTRDIIKDGTMRKPITVEAMVGMIDEAEDLLVELAGGLMTAGAAGAAGAVGAAM